MNDRLMLTRPRGAAIAAGGAAPDPAVVVVTGTRVANRSVADLEWRYALARQLSLALGADNRFDTYPDPVPTTLNTTGNTPYSNYAPFGRGGRFAYARATDAF